MAYSSMKNFKAGRRSLRVLRHGGLTWGLSVLVLFLGACGSDDATRQLSADERFQKAMELYNDGDYLEAIDEFRVVTLQFPGSALSDDAQLYLGECYFQREEYILAAYEYELLIRTHPASPLIPDARYKRGMCYYEMSPASYLDQDYSKKAIDEFQALLEYYPFDPRAADAEAKIRELNTKLAKKSYDSGVIYMKMEYYRAAVMEFDQVLERYHDTPYAEPALLRKGEALLRRLRYGDAKRELERFLVRYPDSMLRRDAEKLLEEVNKEIEG
jgi:outer membrane protein assembly factor BamD